MASTLVKQQRVVDHPFIIYGDLIAIGVWLILTLISIALPILNASAIRMVFALPSILFIPGYALIAALFPQREGLDGLERIALSFGLSIAIVPLIGLVLNYTPWGIRLGPVVSSLVGVTLVFILAATGRRAAVKPKDRFTVQFQEMLCEAHTFLYPKDRTGLDLILNVVLLLSLVVALVVTVYVIAPPKEAEHFTEFYILGAQGKSAEYPRTVQMGKSYPMSIGIGNHEYRNVTYTVEIYLVNMTFDPVTNASYLVTAKTLHRFQVELSHNETGEIPWNLTVSELGSNRIEFLLFNETVPESSIPPADRIGSSYRDLHLWVNVTPKRG